MLKPIVYNWNCVNATYKYKNFMVTKIFDDTKFIKKKNVEWKRKQKVKHLVIYFGEFLGC